MDVAASLVANIFRLDSALTLPAYLIVESTKATRLGCDALLEVHNSLDEHTLTRSEFERVQARAYELRKEHLRQQTKEWWAHQFDFLGVYNASRYMAVGPETVRQGFEAILISQVTGTWTAFETLAADLWVAAINQCPSKLSSLSGKPKDRISRIARGSPRTTDGGTGKVESKKIELGLIHELTRGSFDLSKSMGTLLRRQQSFQRLDDIREAYSVAFKDHSQEIDTILADKTIDALGAVRNLIVHKSCVVDEDYQNKAKDCPLLDHLSVGERLMIDGDMVGALTGPVMNRSIELVKAVDRWITNHGR
jgi:hypothetical protein